MQMTQRNLRRPWTVDVDGVTVRDVAGNAVCTAATPELARMITQLPEYHWAIGERDPESLASDVRLIWDRAEGLVR